MTFSSVKSLQPQVASQIAAVKATFVACRWPDVVALLLIGSCAEGTATYRSDIDFLVVMKTSFPLTYSQVVAYRDQIEQAMNTRQVPECLPCQFTFVLETVRLSDEPAMTAALRKSVTLYATGLPWSAKLKDDVA
jgi:predicted nucleotidyltransferase